MSILTPEIVLLRLKSRLELLFPFIFTILLTLSSLNQSLSLPFNCISLVSIVLGAVPLVLLVLSRLIFSTYPWKWEIAT